MRWQLSCLAGGVALAACVLDWPPPPTVGAGGGSVGGGGSTGTAGSAAGGSIPGCELCPELSFAAPPPGRTIEVAAGGDLQAAIDQAAPGDEIVLEPGGVYSGGIVLPDKSGTEPITIRTADLASISEPCTRLAVEHLAALPKIVGTTEPAIVTDRGHDWRFVGVEFSREHTSFDGEVVLLGSEAETNAVQLPRRLVFDRVYVRGDARHGTLRGMRIHAEDVTIANSRITELYYPVEGNQESHAIIVGNTPGTIKILNNQLESNDAPVALGKYTSALVDVVPTGIEVRFNHFTRPARWIPLDPNGWHLRAMIGFHNAKQVTVEANVLDTNLWQPTFKIEPHRHMGARPWAAVSELTFRHNRIEGAYVVWEIQADDPYTGGAPYSRDILLENNLVTNVELDAIWMRGALSEPIVGFELRHNTILQDNNFMLVDNSENEIVIVDNVLRNGPYGLKCNAGPCCSGCLAMSFTSWEFDYNLMITDSPSDYPQNNNEFVMADPGFVDPSAGDYRLAPSSPGSGTASDGKDMGVDMTALQAAEICRTSP